MSDALPAAWRLRALAACAVLPPLLSVVSFARLAALVGRAAEPGRGGAPDDAVLADYVGHQLSRLPPPWRYTCLRRGIVLYHLLRRAGRPIALHIGVRKNERGVLQAHAWLVKDGAPYLEPGEESHQAFQVIATFPALAAAR
jgi:hypothetical protein